MRIVVTEGHEVEDTFLKNRNSGFVTFSSLAPSDYTIQKVGLDNEIYYMHMWCKLVFRDNNNII